VDGETIPLPTPAELAAEEKQAAAYVERLIELRKKIAGQQTTAREPHTDSRRCRMAASQRPLASWPEALALTLEMLMADCSSVFSSAGQTPSRAAAISFLAAAAAGDSAERPDGSETSEVEVDVDDSALADLHERLLAEAAGEPAMQSEQARLARLLAAELLAEAAATAAQSDRADLSEPAAALDGAQLRAPCPPFHRAYPLRGRGERRFWRSRPFGDFLLFPAPGLMCVPRRLVWRVERILARGGPGPWGRGGRDQRPVPVLIDEETGMPQPQPQVDAEYPAAQGDGSALAVDAEADELAEAAGRATWRQWLDGGASDARWEEHSEL